MYVAFSGLRHVHETPSWFQNFLVELTKKTNSSRLSVKTLGEELALYGAVYRVPNINIGASLEFTTEQDYLMFVLRWS